MKVFTTKFGGGHILEAPASHQRKFSPQKMLFSPKIMKVLLCVWQRNQLTVPIPDVVWEMGMRLLTILYYVRTLDPCRKHQVFESAALAATNPPVKEQASSKKQQQPPRNTGPSPTTTTMDGGWNFAVDCTILIHNHTPLQIMLLTINRNVHYIDGFMGHGFASWGQELVFAFGAVVYKLQTRKSYIESLPLVLKVKEAGSLKVKVPLYSCLLIVCLPSGSRTLNWHLETMKCI